MQKRHFLNPALTIAAMAMCLEENVHKDWKMPTRDIRCLQCGLQGEIEPPGLNDGMPLAGIFKHLGNNAFSGHMHYQCPACGVVILVNPENVVGNEPIHGPMETPHLPSRLLLQWILEFDRINMDEPPRGVYEKLRQEANKSG